MAGYTLPAGYTFANAACGIKKPGRPDLTVILSDRPAAAAAVYTTNRVKAASLAVTRRNLRDGRARAVVVNSGNANACTGKQGTADARSMAAAVADRTGIAPSDVAVASTGVIGVHLPMQRILDGIGTLSPARFTRNPMKTARAIMTTDLKPKIAARRIKISGTTVTFTGIAKGSGMIAPNMATMLGFVVTDAQLSVPFLQKALRAVADDTFNMTTVDGDTSTNDMVLCLANGASGAAPRTTAEKRTCTETMFAVCRDLAKMIAADGEGATTLVNVTVRGAKTKAAARKTAKSIAESNLVKTAVFGNDPNWGRIMCAAGYAGTGIVPEQCVLHLGPHKLFEHGRPVAFNAKKASAYLHKKEVTIDLHLHAGTCEATAYTCDFSYDYVKINAEYTT